MSHHNHDASAPTMADDHCAKHAAKKRIDWLLIGSSLILIASLILHIGVPETLESVRLLSVFVESAVELLQKMWWGILLGILSVGIIGTIPRELITFALGKGGTLNGIIRATGAGVMLDLCSHGILLVGMKLYERGASLGQTMAFLIASPWNSISLTLILWSLVGFQWMISILLLSFVIAIISGLIFDRLVKKGVLPQNPNHIVLPENFSFKKKLSEHLTTIRFTPGSLVRVAMSGLRDSKMILRWIFFGIVLAGLIRTFISPEIFAQLFGPTIGGLGATLLFATILEVCSEGSMPVATDMLLRAKAAGNTFAFLMTGISTDYTEIMALRETTKSWKIAFFLPLVTLPQVVLIAILLNSIPV
ncbi:MAG: permease [Patescibacteria group bacterium]